MKIKRVYISHTNYCSGWNLDQILDGTVFRKAIRTNQRYEVGVKMLDWDFKKPNLGEHLLKAKIYDFELVMAPDVYCERDVDFATKVADKLLKYCERVCIPIHYYDRRLSDYELAYPNATLFNSQRCKNLNVLITEFADSVTHILGGTPNKQLYLAKNYFKNVVSLDGNVLFWAAIKYGKYWDCGWKKPDKQLENKELFRLSVQNLNKIIRTF